MNTELIPTNETYGRILDCTDPDQRRQIYLKTLVEPWQGMMSMMTRPPGDPNQPVDELAGARMWNWLLPDQIDEVARLLEILETADAWTVARSALAQAAARFSRFAGQIPFDTITGWLVLGDPQRSNRFEHGYTGATDWFAPRIIGQIWDPTPGVLRRLPGLVAHEMHHLIRLRAFPWGPHTSLADYIVIEGTAESFATALFGEKVLGFYVSEVEPAQIETARHLIGPALDQTGFDVIRAYVFGDALAEQAHFRPVGGMPTYGGYAVGYHVVQAFLKRTGKSIEEATFLPAQEIVRQSGFFE